MQGSRILCLLVYGWDTGMVILIRKKRKFKKRRRICVMDITHMEERILPGGRPWEWVIL